MSSLYSIGQMNELADALEADGYTTEMLKALTSNGRLTALKSVLDGDAEIRMLEVKPIPAPKPLLEFVGTVTLPATTEEFVAKSCFVHDVSKNAKVKISYLGVNFTAWFLAGEGKIE